MEREIQYWNDESDMWRSLRPFGERGKHMEEEAMKLVSKYAERACSVGTIINIGSGSGERYFDVPLKDKIVSVDYAIEMLRRRGGERVLADARKMLPFADCCADMVTSFFMMRYLTLEQQFLFIDEVSNILRPGGVAILLDVPNNYHVYQKERFDPYILSRPDQRYQILDCKTDEFTASTWIETGFGGWSTSGVYQLSWLVFQKKRLA